MVPQAEGPGRAAPPPSAVRVPPPCSGLLATTRAPAEEFQTVSFDLETRPPRQEAGQFVGLAVRELDHEPAPAADEVVAVVVADPGIVAVAMLQMDVLHQVEPGQQIHGAVNTGQAHPGLDLAGSLMDLCHLQVLRRRPQNLEDRTARPSEPQTMVLEGLSEFGV
jgi:hypothetical protein